MINMRCAITAKVKETEIGWLPEDWDVMPIGQIAEIVGGSTPSTKVSEYWNGEINWFTPTEVGKSKFLKESIRKLTDKGLNSCSASILPAGTILLTTRAGIGDLGILTIPSATNQGFQSIIPGKLMSRDFLYYQLSGLKATLLNNASGSTFLEISPNKLKSILVSVPDIEEQEEIAKILNDVDDWINSLEKVISKKKLIKQAAMQKLLSPKPSWNELTLFEVVEKEKELFNDGDWVEANHIKDSGIRLIQTGNIGVGRFLEKSNKKFINRESYKKLKCKELIDGDILISRLAEPAGRACIFLERMTGKSITSVDVTIFRPRTDIYNRQFILYLLCMENWFKKVEENVGGTTHQRISRSNLGLIKIALPESLDEQTKIAEILYDIDCELIAIEQKLAKAKKLKQGIMYHLLSGHIRVKSNP